MQIAQQARQYLAACEKSPTDAVQVDYDPRNPFDLCSITFTPIYRCSPDVWCTSKLPCDIVSYLLECSCTSRSGQVPCKGCLVPDSHVFAGQIA